MRASRGKIIGTVIAVMAMIACARFARQHVDALPPISWDLGTLLTLAAVALLQVASLIVLALGWRGWLRALGHPLSTRRVTSVFLGAQLAKYLPGNVFQYAARVELLHRHGTRRSEATRSVVLESATLVLTGLTIAVLVAQGPGEPLLRQLIDHVSPRRAARMLALIVIAGLGGLLIAGQRWGRATRVPRRALLGALLGSVPLYVTFFALQCAGLWLVASRLFATEDVPLVLLWGVISLAWTAGFVTPGAPAGLGVRDLILLTALDALAGPGTALGIAGFHRLATVAGDALAFGVAAALRPETPPEAEQPVH